jgi:serine/threonine protein kinase
VTDRRKNYILESKPLGRGGQAEVFLARSKREKGKKVAFKRVRSKRQVSLARMKREIEVMKSIRHDNIMPVIEWSEKYEWYTMPLAERVLDDCRDEISDEELLVIVKSCAAALSTAHQKGYVHRDLTPNNILQLPADFDNRWVVSDWGLVRRPLDLQTNVRTVQGRPIGTLGYAAPEMWVDAHSADGRADIYSLGRIVAWCKTGCEPIPNKKTAVEGIWHDFVDRTTSSEPSERPSTMADIISILDKFNLAEDALISWFRSVRGMSKPVTHHVRFRLKRCSKAFVFPVSDENVRRLRHYMTGPRKDLNLDYFYFSSLNGRDVCLRIDSLEYVNLLWDVGTRGPTNRTEDSTAEWTFVYFDSGNEEYSVSTEDSERLFDVLNRLEMRDIVDNPFAGLLDEDGEELFFRLDNIAMFDAPSWLVNEGRVKLMGADV